MSDIYAGLTTNNMKKVMVSWPSYKPGVTPDDLVSITLDGTLKRTGGLSARIYEGAFEISDDQPAYGDGTLDFLESLWAADYFYIRDTDGVNVPVIWVSDFQLEWLSQNAAYGRVAFKLMERV